MIHSLDKLVPPVSVITRLPLQLYENYIILNSARIFVKQCSKYSKMLRFFSLENFVMKIDKIIS